MASTRTVGRKATQEEVKAINPEKYYVKLRLELGPKFLPKGQVTKGTLARCLRKRAALHKKSFLKRMFNHLAEHIEQNAAHSDDPKHYLS